jgi:hypothetical protein
MGPDTRAVTQVLESGMLTQGVDSELSTIEDALRCYFQSISMSAFSCFPAWHGNMSHKCRPGALAL